MAIDWEAISKEKELEKKAEFIRQGGTAIDWEAISKEKELEKKAEFIRQGGVAVIDKTEDFPSKRVKLILQFFLLVLVLILIYMRIQKEGLSDFVGGMGASFVVLVIIGILYSVFKNDKPDEEA